MDDIIKAEKIGTMFQFTYGNGRSFYGIRGEDGCWYSCHDTKVDLTTSKWPDVAVDYEEAVNKFLGDGWISCSDRMPEENLKDILIYSNSYDRIFIAGLTTGKEEGGTEFKFFEAGQYKILAKGVTHWRPLPGIPKGVENNG